MSLRAAALALLAATWPVALPAQVAQTPGPAPEAAAPASPADVRAVFEALELPGVVAVMAEEGRASGEELAASVFGAAPPPPDWAEAVAAIYDEARMRDEVLAVLEDELAAEDVAPILDFFGSEPGRTLVGLELAAREAMIDDDVEAAAKEAAAVALADDDPRADLLRRYAEANDLFETNVTAAMNGNFAYVMGLLDGGALGGDATEADVLADVWAQEPQIRADTAEWIMAFLLMAYSGASDEDIEAQIAFSESPPGQALNRALFRAFEGTFEDISRRLGLASARYMTSQEL